VPPFVATIFPSLVNSKLYPAKSAVLSSEGLLSVNLVIEKSPVTVVLWELFPLSLLDGVLTCLVQDVAKNAAVITARLSNFFMCFVFTGVKLKRGAVVEE
jgi:hypothetical protein